MSFQFNIDEIKNIKINYIIQSPIVIALYILLLTPVYTYTIYHITTVLKSVIVNETNYNYTKIILIFMIGFISIYTAIMIAISIAESSYNITKKIYTMLAYNSIQLFDSIFYIIYFGLYIILFTLVLLLPVDISLFLTIIYIISNQ